MTMMLAQATTDGLPWWVFAPSLVMLAFVVLTAPSGPTAAGGAGRSPG